jgi:DNA-binding MarR family transcriptional regulator
VAVKPISESERIAASDDDVRELMPLVRTVFRALKRGGPVPAPFQDAFERASLGPRHVPPLLTVTFEGELSVSQLAEELGLSLSTTSLMVGELSKAGLLERSEDENDRRRTIVRLNEDYREGVSAWMNERLDPFRRTLERLSARARADFIEGWRILGEESERIGGPESDPNCPPE